MRKATEPEAKDPTVCTVCQTIPVSVFALDYDRPMNGWPAFLEANGIEVLTDDIGRDAITRADAHRLIEQRKQRDAQIAEERARRLVEKKRPRAPIGIPAPVGSNASALEVMMSYDQEKNQ